MSGRINSLVQLLNSFLCVDVCYIMHLFVFAGRHVTVMIHRHKHMHKMLIKHLYWGIQQNNVIQQTMLLIQSPERECVLASHESCRVFPTNILHCTVGWYFSRNPTLQLPDLEL